MNRPAVDILIPFYGNYESVTKSIGCILQCTPNINYRIILIDDASPNDFYLKNMCATNKKVHGVRLEEQSGFGAALNKGFEQSTSDHIVIMHSDVYVDNIHWLKSLYLTLKSLRDGGVKLVVSRTNNAGTANNYDERLVGERKHEYEKDIIVDEPLPLHCACMNRELFKRIGGFIKSYPYCWYEDVELFYRMKHCGYKQAISVNSYVNHVGGLTIEKLGSKERKKMEKNRDLCLNDIAYYRR